MSIAKQNYTFYKLKLVKTIQAQIDSYRQQLTSDLVSYATDPSILTRRLRMLSQLSSYESQLLAKIKDFKTNDVADLSDALREIELELVFVINRNA